MKKLVCIMAFLVLLALCGMAAAEEAKQLVSFKQENPVIAIGEKKAMSIVFDASVKKANAEMTWTSSDESVLTVNTKGTVLGQAAGKATVSCEIKLRSGETLRAETEVEVIQPVKKLTLKTDAPFTAGVGQVKKMEYVFEPADATHPEAEWSVADPKVAEVDEDGNIRGLKAGRTRVKIIAKDGYGASASDEISVSSVYTETEEITLAEMKPVTVTFHFMGREPEEDADAQAEEAEAGEKTGEEAEPEISPDQEWFEKNYTVLLEGDGVEYSSEITGDEAVFTLTPKAAAEETHLIVRDRANAQYKADVLIHVKESAICDAQKLPVVNAELLSGTGALTYRMELTNNSDAEIGEIGFLVDYRDQFGDTFYLFSNNDGTIQNYSYTTKFNIQPGQTLPLLGRTEAFKSDDIITEVRVAINYYRYVGTGIKVYIPDSQLYWYSTSTGAMPRPEIPQNYVQPDEDTTDLAERISTRLRATTCDLYSYVVKRFSRSKQPGKYIASVSDGGWAKLWGLEAMDVVYGADDLLWKDDPFFLDRVYARVYNGEEVILKVIRNGEEIEIPISKEAAGQ